MYELAILFDAEAKFTDYATREEQLQGRQAQPPDGGGENFVDVRRTQETLQNGVHETQVAVGVVEAGGDLVSGSYPRLGGREVASWSTGGKLHLTRSSRTGM